MFIQRIQVEEGFLDGLDLSFAPGLNVLIGPRGSGKTSVIELIRFALGAPSYSDEAASTSRKHALSVLGSGRVALTVLQDGEQINISRTADEDDPRATRRFRPPLILAQKEVEALGLQAMGRLRIIDGFRTEPDRLNDKEEQVRAFVRSVVKEIRSETDELEQLLENTRALEVATEELEQLSKQEKELLAKLEGSIKEKAELDNIASFLAQLSVRASFYDRSINAVTRWFARSKELLSFTPKLEDWPQNAGGEDPLAKTRNQIALSAKQLSSAIDTIQSVLKELEALKAANTNDLLAKEDGARVLRRRLEELHEGAGAVSKRLAEMKSRASQAASLRSVVAKKKDQLKLLRDRRDQHTG
ncbi:MAG: AAA family ATPase [Verrucomicrobiia bacterium]